MLILQPPFYQAAFELGHAVDTAKTIKWPDGVEAKKETHTTKGAEGTKLSVGFPEPDMATVEIYPCGKVEVSSAASEKAAKRIMETVSSAFQEAGCAPWDDVTTAENTFRITNVTAKYEKGGSMMIDLGGTSKNFGTSDFTYEPELKLSTLRLWQNGNKVTFRFNTKTITVWGKALEEMESLFVHKVFERVKWMAAPTPEPTPAGAATPQSAPNRCARTALEDAVRAIVGGNLPPRPDGGYLSRHSQIQQWLQRTHPEIPALPDYDRAWGAPGRQGQKARARRRWAGQPYEAFWDNHMVPALAGSPVKEVGWSVPSVSAATPAAAASTPTTAAASSAPAASSSAEAGGAASSAMPPAEVAPAEVVSSDSETGDMQRLQAALAEIARNEQQASTSDTVTFSKSVLYAQILALMEEARDDGRDNGLLEAELGASLDAAEQGPGYTSLGAPSDDAQGPAFRSLSADGDESGGARRATASRVLPWCCTNRHRSCAGVEVEVPPGKKQKRGGASEAPRDVAARLLQDLEGVACPLPETAELHDECVRICMLMMRSR